MDITKIKTDTEHLIILRNNISYRLIEAKANIFYWQDVIKRSKQNSQEIVDARQSISLNEQNLKKDKLFLRCIDLMIKEEK
ncbi:hypothetical protein M0R04_12385 [Candidatus Dojkabacteria bacterium]|jgi:hypothetical protein|nr:hypothetical protein [Candidatus Dojkabacteria bacterium]